MNALIPQAVEGTAVKSSSVLIAAATRWEAQPLRAGFGLTKGDSQSWAGQVGARRVRLLRTGMGAQAVTAVLSRIDAGQDALGLIVSAGFAGALQRDLRTGDIIVEELTPGPLAVAALSRGNVRHHFGRIANADKVLTDPGDKLALGKSTGALAVDMESAAIRAWARQHGLAALALRVIFDEADHVLPRGLPMSDSPLSLGLYAATHPLAWPRLAELWSLQRRAAAALSAAVLAFLEAL
jgi:nucleoside phosphorylase